MFGTDSRVSSRCRSINIERGNMNFDMKRRLLDFFCLFLLRCEARRAAELRQLDQAHAFEHGFKVLCTIGSSIKRAGPARWRVASSVHNPGHAVDEPSVRASVRHARVDKGLELVDIIPAAHVIRLHRIHPIKQARHPFKLWMLVARANRLRIAAKVDAGVHGGATFSLRTCAEEVVELSKVTHSSRLNHTASPVATAFNVRPRLASKRRRRVVRARLAAAQLEPARFLPGVIAAVGVWIVQVLKVLVRRHVCIARHVRIAPR
mmetsp:Transcript_9945/g.20892  ORF Transcript_9945/g.20892 Transcript_9945/m.20892 type:complete len:263 (-) Transcript_9945:366-1154(-)